LNQTSIDLFNIVRPNDNNICAAISNKVEKVKVYIENIFSPLNTISEIRSKELNTNNIRKNSYLVKTKRINDLVKDKFDFLNIDVEGMDLKVLKSINLNYYEPKLICIEVLNSKQLDDLKKYLKKFGYTFIKKLGPSYFFSSKNHS
jgi:FkbM family methyltransferase